MWNCSVCEEEIENHFDACWNCQTTRSGHQGIPNPEAEEPDHRLKALVNQRHKPMKCLRCSGSLVHRGTKDFHEGPKFGALGDLAELLVGQQSLDMYLCDGCGHVEFFVFEI